MKPSPLGEEVSTFISADTAPCDDCLKELERDKRRKEYPLLIGINCIHDIRLLNLYPMIVSERRWMSFMCEACKVEYEDIEGRRYQS